MLPSTVSRLPIRIRLAAVYALFLALAVVAAGVLLLAAMEGQMMREADETLALRVAQIEREIDLAMETELNPAAVLAAISDVLPSEEFSAPGIYVQVLDPRGATLASSPNLPGGQLPGRSAIVGAALGGREAYATVLVEGERVRELARPVLQDERVLGVVLVGESLHLLDATLRAMRQMLAIAAIAAAVACLLAGWWLAAGALRPVAEVIRVARHISSTGQFDRRIEAPPAQDELRALATTFNDMLARLEKTFRYQREFLADASHELRGPLMVIRGNLDLLRLDVPEREREECAREASEEVERMSNLVSDLLFLSEVDAQEMLWRLPVPLHDVVSDVWERAKGLEPVTHQIELARNDPATVLGDPERLSQMLWNLVSNALRYTPPGGRITVSLRSLAGFATVEVADTGIGIPPEHLPRIFERFYRVDRLRHQDAGGSGLGLAIVKQVAEAHGGKVSVRSKLQEGSVFTVILPVQQTQPPS